MTERRDPPRWIDDPDHAWPHDFREALGGYGQIAPPAELSARVYERIEAAVAPPPAATSLASWPKRGLFGLLATASAAILLQLALRSAPAAMPEHALETPSPSALPEHAPSPPSAALTPPDALLSPTPSSPAAAQRASSEPPRSAPSPRRARQKTTDTRVDRSSAAAAEAPADTGAELTLLVRARSVVRSAPARALEFVGQHAAAYPKSAFAEERAVLTIEAERRLGRAAAAEAHAREFLRAHPTSIHRSLIETSTTHR